MCASLNRFYLINEPCTNKTSVNDASHVAPHSGHDHCADAHDHDGGAGRHDCYADGHDGHYGGHDGSGHDHGYYLLIPRPPPGQTRPAADLNHHENFLVHKISLY